MATSEIAAVELDRVEFDLKVLRDNFAIEREYRLKAEAELADAYKEIQRLKDALTDKEVSAPQAVSTPGEGIAELKSRVDKLFEVQRELSALFDQVVILLDSYGE